MEKLTRLQRRQISRMESEAKQVHDKLCQEFQNFIVMNDAEENSIQEKKLNVCRRWKTYCKINGTSEEAYTLLEEFCNKVIELHNS